MNIDELFDKAERDVINILRDAKESAKELQMSFKVKHDTANPIVTPPPLSDGFAITLASAVITGSETATTVKIGVAANEYCQCKTQIRVQGQTDWVQKNNEQSFDYGIANPTYGHIHTVRQLAPSTTYEYRQLLTDADGTVLPSDDPPVAGTFTTAAAPVATNDNTPPVGNDAFWTGQGYALDFADTPSSAEASALLPAVDYFETDHFTLGNANNFNSDHGNGDRNRVMLDPVDNLPAIRTTVSTGEINGHRFSSEQWGKQGLLKKDVVFSVEMMTPSGGLASEQAVFDPDFQNSGMYSGPGHFVFTRINQNTKYFGAGAVNWQDVSYNMRLTISTSGHYSVYAKIAQGSPTQTEQAKAFYKSDISEKWINHYVGQWSLLELHVRLNDEGQSNGHIHVYQNTRRIITRDNIKIRHYGDAWARGWGMLHQHTGVRNTNAAQHESIFHRNFKIYGK